MSAWLAVPLAVVGLIVASALFIGFFVVLDALAVWLMLLGVVALLIGAVATITWCLMTGTRGDLPTWIVVVLVGGCGVMALGAMGDPET